MKIMVKVHNNNNVKKKEEEEEKKKKKKSILILKSTVYLPVARYRHFRTTKKLLKVKFQIFFLKEGYLVGY